MLRSMFTAIGSLTLHQSYLDVIADNLANVNTPGYKSNRAAFQTQIAQSLQAGSAPSATLGGINPTQIGLGVRMGAIATNFSQGTLQETGRLTDLAIQGDGLFVYRDGTRNLFSRDGAVDFDADGYLVNISSGMRLQGWQASGSAGTINTSMPVGDIQIPNNSTLARATSQTVLTGNLNSIAASGSASTYSSTMSVYDSLGGLHPVTVTFTKQSDGVWDWSATSGSAGVPGAAGTGTVTFDTNGQYVSGSGTLNLPAAGGAAAISAALDLSGMTQLASTSSVALSYQNGLGAGNLTGFNIISNTGELYGVYSNGLQQRLGQVALATFANPSGLQRAGQSAYTVGLNSGDPNIGAPGVGGRGTLVSGYLEASNVDMAQEFTNMILAQRGFQASSRIITTSDEMLQELVNLKR